MKITSWNVNSLKVRQAHVLSYLQDYDCDVLGLQELKQTTEAVDKQTFTDAGYHVAIYGQKTYNGVALISKFPLKDVVHGFPNYEDSQARAIAATVNGVRVVNLYVPNGKAVGDEKYVYKLAWLEALHEYIKAEQRHYEKMIILGDFNIAPADIDVHDPKAWEGKILCSKPERAALQALLDLGFHDAFRTLNPTQQTFSWWDYRMGGLRRNVGLRIDLTLTSETLPIAQADIDIEPRRWERPSDHAPAYVRLKNT